MLQTVELHGVRYVIIRETAQTWRVIELKPDGTLSQPSCEDARRALIKYLFGE